MISLVNSSNSYFNNSAQHFKSNSGMTNAITNNGVLILWIKKGVYINGAFYPVKTTPDLFCCDRIKEVVVIDGKQYEVKNRVNAVLQGTIGDIFTHREK